VLALLTDPKNEFLIHCVEDAASSFKPEVPCKVIDFSMAHRASYAEVPLFGKDIALSTAAIIDTDLRPIEHISLRIGSVAGYLIRHLAGTSEPESVIRALDQRMLFVTAGPIEQCEIYRQFSGYYSVVSTKNRDRRAIAYLIAEWLREILGRNTPRVFVSYRSTRKADAESIATLLLARGANLWFDDLSIPVGASITEEVNRGLGWCTHFVLLVDEDFFESKWASTEFEAIMYRRLAGGPFGTRGPDSPLLIPLFFADPNHKSIPPMLQNIRGVNMKNHTVESAVDAIWPALTIVGRR
jgi:hypothetical protein